MSVTGIDASRVRATLVKGLPETARWGLKGVPLLFDFVRLKEPLRHVQPDDFVGCDDLEPAWARLLVFGARRYEGGASPLLGVHDETGEVFGLSVDSPSEALFFLNSDADRFVATFALFDRAFRTGEPSVDVLVELAARVDPERFKESDWHAMIEHVQQRD